MWQTLLFLFKLLYIFFSSNFVLVGLKLLFIDTRFSGRITLVTISEQFKNYLPSKTMNKFVFVQVGHRQSCNIHN